ncbi:type VI secretion system tip protein VgrG [Paraburkholderia tropica]|uniref:type VI secretion system Vgr family protein n=1 Tax=Paraburkholderia tropica TaxID=92647 RepID=UPI0015FFCB0F|nr:type VI secretion system tip protein TssI/VgrG [Paraburkholderia tropica]QNB14648.1 type VI secretion system tip protein VgrG [Paraburkholderia tropica]
MLTLLKNRTVTMSGPAVPVSMFGEPALQLRMITGVETLSEISEYLIECQTPLEIPESEAANLDLKSMIGKELTVSIQLDGMGTFVPGLPGFAGAANIGAGTREISGLVVAARYTGQSNRQSRYQLSLKPWVWLMEHRSDYRTFQRKSVVTIIEEVFGNYMYSYDLRLSETYPMLDYQVQYGETDYHFFSRLAAEHGIYWFIEHSDGFHRLVLVDQLGAHKPVDSVAYQTLPYYPPGHKIDQEYISNFNMASSVQSGRWTTNDFDFKKPHAKLIAQNDLPQETAHNDFERYEWPGDYTSQADGDTFARLRMEEVRARGEQASGSGNVRDIVCGTTFTLTGYPHEAANQEYLVVSASLSAVELSESTGGSSYEISSTFSVLPATTVFRPSRERFPKPRTTGPQTAIVTGPPGKEIWTDKYGRVKLSFHWDRSGVKNQNSSCWVRVSYPWAGSNFGGVNIPRVGQEVVVDFENGDPDRPMVVGRLFNAASMPPWDLPGSATQSGIMSRSMKGGKSNFSGMRFDDKKGAEEFMMQAEKDMNTTIKNNETHTVGADRTKTVVGDETATIKGDRTEAVDGEHAETIKGDISQTSTKGDISVKSEAGMITISAKTQLKLEVQGTVIVLTPESIGMLSKVIQSQSKNQTSIQGEQVLLNC